MFLFEALSEDHDKESEHMRIRKKRGAVKERENNSLFYRFASARIIEMNKLHFVGSKSPPYRLVESITKDYCKKI